MATVTSNAPGARPVAAPPCDVLRVNSITGTGAPTGIDAEVISATRTPIALICSSVSALLPVMPLPIATGPPATMLGGVAGPVGPGPPDGPVGPVGPVAPLLPPSPEQPAMPTAATAINASSATRDRETPRTVPDFIADSPGNAMDMSSRPTSSACKGAPQQRRQVRRDASGLSRSDDTADTRNSQRGDNLREDRTSRRKLSISKPRVVQ